MNVSWYFLTHTSRNYKICLGDATVKLNAQKITSYKDNEMKKEVHYKNHLTDSLISNISNENHFIEIKRCQKRLSTASVSTSSRSSLPKKRIKREDIKSEREDSGGVQETIQILFFSFLTHRLILI